MKRYNIINNSLGWLCFLIAAVCYLMTIEPTASFWDCPEFIAQGFKLEVGHPPGNPIFMLTARFFVTLFGGDPADAAVAVNSMSAILSAATILLLFWTITHLVRKLIVRDGATEISWLKTAVIMGAGFCGAMMYAWSDTFWFSAVEGEVYAFSSFCTALVFWLILKWENRADQPHSDRYLVLIAYIIGISIAVHLLNLLCIPAIVLVFYYRKFRDTNLKGSLAALGVSVLIIVFILYGLVPGFIGVAQVFELFAVNTLGLGYNVGVLVYAIVLLAVLIWTAASLYRQDNPRAIRWGVFLSVVLSGMLYIGHSILLFLVLVAALAVYLFFMCKRIPVRVFNVSILSILVIFIGYSSYALLLIRANAETPMNQNAPDNVFALSSYLNREQYGENPLFYGPTFAEEIDWAGQDYDENGNIVSYAAVDENGYPRTKIIRGLMYKGGEIIDNGEDRYIKAVKTSPGQPDRYVREEHIPKYETSPEMGMFFTRMYSSKPMHVTSYKTWTEYENPDFKNIPYAMRKEWAARRGGPDGGGFVLSTELNPYLSSQKEISLGTDAAGEEQTVYGWTGDFGTNLRYFIGYQLNHMYWRYFMWNFAGRQNDIQSQGEPYAGNWISGIPAIDNARLGDQSLLPAEYGEENPGHNVFYMLPLLLGIFGLLWQALKTHRYAPTRGIEQFWVVFFLFFMTGIAIVLYLNQTPGQPRERDYAFAGSFYAFAIWVGMGVPAIAWALRAAFARFFVKEDKAQAAAPLHAGTSADKAAGRQQRLDAQWAREDSLSSGLKWTAAGIAILLGIFVPLQVVSQTWDDHDRSGRYTARDFGENYLNSLDENAIIFVNGDNDTFPLWYAQEVEGVRPDVKVVNLSYLSTDWYANQIRSASYTAKGVPMFAGPEDYAYNKLQYINWSAKKFFSILASDVLRDEPQFAGEIYARPATPEQALQMSKEFKAAAEAIPDTVTLAEAMKNFYDGKTPGSDIMKKMYPTVSNFFTYDNVVVPLDPAKIQKRFGMLPPVDSTGRAYMSVSPGRIGSADGNFSGGLSDWLVYDIVSKSAAGNFERPVYFATTIGPDYYPGWEPNTFVAGMAYQVTPFDRNSDPTLTSPIAAKAYNNIVGKFRWGGLDVAKPGKLYLDETVRSMVFSTRRAILAAVDDCIDHGQEAAPKSAQEVSRQKGLPVPATYLDMAENLLKVMDTRLPASVCPMMNGMDLMVAETYLRLGIAKRSSKLIAKARALALGAVPRNAAFIKYALSLNDNLRGKITSTERQNLRYNLPQIIAIVNLADVADAIIRRPVTSGSLEGTSQTDQLYALQSLASVIENLNMVLYTYVYELTPEEIESVMSSPSFGAYYGQVNLLNEAYGLGTGKARNEVLGKAGINATTLNRLVTF